MADDIKSTPTPELSSILGELLSNKELMAKIGEIANNIKPEEAVAAPAEPQTNNIDGLLSNPDIISKLPDVINVIKPLMSADSQDSGAHEDNKRLALLMALKPYLSPKRCEAIDYIARMSKLSQTVKGLKL